MAPSLLAKRAGDDSATRPSPLAHQVFLSPL